MSFNVMTNSTSYYPAFTFGAWEKCLGTGTELWPVHMGFTILQLGDEMTKEVDTF